MCNPTQPLAINRVTSEVKMNTSNITDSTIDTINFKTLSICKANNGIDVCSRLVMEIVTYIDNDESVVGNNELEGLINLSTIEGLLDAVGELTHGIAGHAEWIDDHTRKAIM